MRCRQAVVKLIFIVLVFELHAIRLRKGFHISFVQVVVGVVSIISDCLNSYKFVRCVTVVMN